MFADVQNFVQLRTSLESLGLIGRGLKIGKKIVHKIVVHHKKKKSDGSPSTSTVNEPVSYGDSADPSDDYTAEDMCPQLGGMWDGGICYAPLAITDDNSGSS
jgi:hypothetical protein